MSTPSTKIIPACSGSPMRAPCRRSPAAARSPAEHRLGIDAHRVGQLRVQVDALVVAVNRHDIARADEVEHQLELLGEAVAGGVDRRLAGRDHVAADVVEPVDRLVDGALVAGDRRGREHHRVATAQGDLAVVVVGHPPQCGQRLALGSGRDHDHLMVGPILHLVGLDHHPLGHLDVAQRAADVDVLAHRAAHQRDLAPQRGGGVDHLLDAVDVGGEARDDDAALGAAEHLLQVGADLALGRGEARAVGVGGVAAEQQHALGAQLGQPRDVGRLAVDRGLVELVVAGQQHRAQIGADGHRARVGDRVRHVDELQGERAHLELLAGGDVLEVDVVAGCARPAWSGPWRSSAGRRARGCRRRHRARAVPTAARRGDPRGRG